MEFVSAPEIIDDSPWISPENLMAIGVALAIIFVLVVLYSIVKFQRNRKQMRHEWQKEDLVRDNPNAQAQQKLNFSPLISFKAKSLFNKDSLVVRQILEDTAWKINADFSVLIRIGLDQFLTPDGGKNDQAERASVISGLKSEILDFLIINADGLPVLGVVQHQGGPANMRRQPDDPQIQNLKKVLNSAGIRFFEVPAGFRPRYVAKQLKKNLKSAI